MKVNVLSAFSNLIRLQLITCLSRGEKNVTQLINTCKLSQSAVSQHLEKLRLSGLVTTRREGKEIYYKLLYPKASKLSSDLQLLIKEVSK